MASDKESTNLTQREIKSMYQSLIATDETPSQNRTTGDRRNLDKAIDEIYLQAHVHRNKLVNFYIIYTVTFSIFVALLVVFQAAVRTVPGSETVEIIPEWTLSLLVAGMFGQFISLLTIVTTKVWTFEPFLKHHLDQQTKTPDNRSNT